MSFVKSRFFFYIMSVGFKIRDTLTPRVRVLAEVDIKPGYSVLDFGCGPGSYTFPAAGLVGETGVVYAADINPSVIQHISKKAANNNIANIEPIETDCDTGLDDATIDVAFMYDLFHMLNNPYQVLAEIHRILKFDGILSFNDHHMKNKDIIDGIEGSRLFKLKDKQKMTYSFSPVWDET